MSVSVQRSTGVVKWFNNKAGYGFLTLVGEGQTPEDIFVHHSSIVVGKDQFRYLVQGEYVEFVLSMDAGVHNCQATDVRGVNGGKLMCETHRENRVERTTPTTRDESSSRGRGGSSRGGSTRGGRGGSSRGGSTRGGLSLRIPVQSDDEQTEWFLVKRKRTEPRSSSTHRRPVAELS
jgi:cold shock CspA family protein